MLTQGASTNKRIEVIGRSISTHQNRNRSFPRGKIVERIQVERTACSHTNKMQPKTTFAFQSN